MLISSKSSEKLKEKLSCPGDIYCSGLFLSARWFVLSGVVESGLHIVVLPDKESAEYCVSDLYGLIEGDRVFFLPDSGKNLERSNYKSTLKVQRTSAIGKVMDMEDDDLLILVTYPSAMEEGIMDTENIRKSLLKIEVGDEISHDTIGDILFDNGFEKVDFFHFTSAIEQISVILENESA